MYFYVIQKKTKQKKKKKRKNERSRRFRWILKIRIYFDTPYVASGGSGVGPSLCWTSSFKVLKYIRYIFKKKKSLEAKHSNKTGRIWTGTLPDIFHHKIFPDTIESNSI